MFMMLLIDALDDINFQIRTWSCIQTLVEGSQSDDCMSYRSDIVTLLQDQPGPECRVVEAGEFIGGTLSKDLEVPILFFRRMNIQAGAVEAQGRYPWLELYQSSSL